MRRIFVPLLFLSLVLFACSPSGLSAESTPGNPAAVPTTPAAESPTDAVIPVITQPVLPTKKAIATFSTPHIDQGPDGAITAPPSDPGACGYQWAYQDMPELSASFLQSLQTLQPEAQGNAFAFGENCMLNDGSVGHFLPMETDFNVTLQVNDVTNPSELGEWIVKVMQVIDAIPPDQIRGPRPGRVSMGFQSSGQQEAISFYIDRYHGLSPGLSSAEIYQALKTQ